MGPPAAVFHVPLLRLRRLVPCQQGVDPLTSIAALVHLVEGIPFAATLLFILTVHEFGHYFAARRWGVRASLPYFLPLPLCFLSRHFGRGHQNSLPHSQQARPPRHWCRWPPSGLCQSPSRPAFAGLSRSRRGLSRLLSLFPNRIGGTLALFWHRPLSSYPPLGRTKWSS